MDDSLGLGGVGAQAVEVLQRATAYRGAGGGQGGRRGIRASEPDDLMPGVDEIGHEGGTDEPGRAGDEHTHGGALLG
jgi:hypothetical protein